MVRQNLVFEPTTRQQLAWALLKRSEVIDLTYGGAKGGGKSHFLCVWAYCQAWNLAHEFKMPKSKHPPHVGWIGRKQSTDFTATTLATWRRVIPSSAYELRGATDKDPKHILIDNRIAIDYGGLDKQENIEKFNSAEYTFFAVDQAEEVNQDDVSVLRASRRMTIDGYELDYKGLFTCNPRQCWLKDEFVDSQVKWRRFVQALPSDNPHLPSTYVDMLKEAFKHRPELLEAYLHGSWTAFADPAQIIAEAELIKALSRQIIMNPVCYYISVDPARFGDDESVLYLFKDTDIIAQKVFPKIPSDRLNLETHKWAIENKCIAVVIDESGMGGPVVDWQRKLAGEKYRVFGVQSEAAATDTKTYYNTRAEMWDKASRMLIEGDICLSCDKTLEEEDWRLLRSQLCTPRYDFRGDKLIVEPKADIKARLGRSPDRADSAVLGWYKYPAIRKLVKTSRTSGFEPRKRSAMAS